MHLSDELLRINQLLTTLLQLIRVFVGVQYLALDGHCGHPQAVLLARARPALDFQVAQGAALYEPYAGAYGGRGLQKKYGARLVYDQLPSKYLQKTEQAGDLRTEYYQGRFLHQEFGPALNVVILVKTKVKTHQVGPVILFSSELALE